jgi:hypothetical protein
MNAWSNLHLLGQPNTLRRTSKLRWHLLTDSLSWPKVRWDDEFLYVGAFLEEPDVWWVAAGRGAIQAPLGMFCTENHE